jgi:ribosomal protein L10
MAITKAKKQDILAKLETIKKDSESIVFVHFKGVSGVIRAQCERSFVRRV